MDDAQLQEWAEELAKECPNPDCVCRQGEV